MWNWKRRAHNINANESNENLLPRDVVDWNGNAYDSHNILADAHAKGTDEEKATATKAFDTPYCWYGHCNVYDIRGDIDQERALDSRILEESGSIIEDEIDSSELLPSWETCHVVSWKMEVENIRLNEDPGQGSKGNLVAWGLEAVKIRALAKASLFFEIRTDFVQFKFDYRIGGQ